jgi:glycosyltransferase involved in cell wall biosynthesis
VPHSAPTVTLLARFQSVKGHSVLLDAAAQILDAFPETRLLLVGDTAFELQEANETRQQVRERVAADERLRAAVVFCGFRRDIPRVLHATDVLVCPSWFETYGMANLEAMACGVPVVSTNFGGPSETIVDGESGFLAPPRNPAALAARIVQLLGDAALRKRIGENARRRVLARYDLRESAARLQDVYEQAVSGARR